MIQQYINIRQGGGGSVSLTVSDTTPNVGDTITLTATANFAATTFFFYARQGNELYLIGENSTGVLNWQVNLFNNFSLFVQANDTINGVFNAGGEPIAVVSSIGTNGLRLWYDPHLSGIAGSLYPDLSPTGANGSLTNSPSVNTSFVGGFVNFNGVNQFITNIGTTADYSFIQNTLQFTIMGFIRPSVSQNNRCICSNASGTDGRGHLLRIFTSSLSIEIFRATANVSYRITPNYTHVAGQWFHFALTCNGLGTGSAYINGQPVTANVTNQNGYTLATGNSQRVMTIGARQITAFDLFFNGRVAPFLMYNRQLSAGEVLNNFNTDRTRYGL
jgi:hypothetical protein